MESDENTKSSNENIEPSDENTKPSNKNIEPSNESTESSNENTESEKVIEEFIRQYPLQKHALEKIAKMVMRDCRRALRKSDPPIDAIFSCRAKKKESLRQKLKDRSDKKPKRYTSAQQIWNDISDMAGVRVALYNPGLAGQVGEKLEKFFKDNRKCELRLVDPNRHDREPQEPGNVEAQKVSEPLGPTATDAQPREGYHRRFSGYKGKHYRMRISTSAGDSEEDNSGYDVRQNGDRGQICVEIQIVSLMIHIWAELGHDIDYKKKKGEPSRQESMLLDGIQGMMEAGEVFVEHLAGVHHDRISELTRNFPDVWDLIKFLKEMIPAPTHELVHERQSRPLFETLRKFEQDSRDRLMAVFDELSFRDPSNAKRQALEAFYRPLTLPPPVQIMAHILLEKKDELQITIEKEKVRNKKNEDAYRFTILIDCLKWFISNLFQPIPEVERKVSDIFSRQNLGNDVFKALQWALDGAKRVGIMKGTEIADNDERGDIDKLWEWFGKCTEPMIAFTFKIACLGIHAPGDRTQLRTTWMYHDILTSPTAPEERQEMEN